MKIVVLAGGYSPERDVSLASGSLIANALLDRGEEVVLLDAYLGVGLDGREPSALFETKESGRRYESPVPEREPDLAALREQSGNGDRLIGKNVLALCQAADVVFIAMHGAMGENGQIQALFDLMGVRYTGTGYAGCLLAMDKDVTKKLLRQEGIPTADWLTVCPQAGGAALTPEWYPCVVKPCGCGSSVGVSLVSSPSELQAALEAAAQYERQVLIERMVKGREFSVGVLNGKALPPIEIIPKEGFYDYKNKYQSGLTTEICPADLTSQEDQKVRELALRVHRALKLGFYSRVDFILDQYGAFVCLEANTLPGMTPTSLLPQEAAADGMPYGELCAEIARAAVQG